MNRNTPEAETKSYYPGKLQLYAHLFDYDPVTICIFEGLDHDHIIDRVSHDLEKANRAYAIRRRPNGMQEVVVPVVTSKTFAGIASPNYPDEAERAQIAVAETDIVHDSLRAAIRLHAQQLDALKAENEVLRREIVRLSSQIAHLNTTSQTEKRVKSGYSRVVYDLGKFLAAFDLLRHPDGRLMSQAEAAEALDMKSPNISILRSAARLGRSEWKPNTKICDRIMVVFGEETEMSIRFDDGNGNEAIGKGGNMHGRRENVLRSEMAEEETFEEEDSYPDEEVPDLQ